MRQQSALPRLRGALCSALLLACALPTAAADIELPLELDLAIVEEALAAQLFNGADRKAELFHDSKACNALTLSDPRVEGTEQGQLRLTSRFDARIGLLLGGRCRMPVAWSGLIETFEDVRVTPGSDRVSFRVTDSNMLSSEDGSRKLPGMLWDWIKDQVHPRLGAITLDFGPALTELRSLIHDALPTALEERNAVASSLQLRGAHARPGALTVVMSMRAPSVVVAELPAGDPAPLTEAELAAWDAAWQAWDAFATWLIKDLAAPADPELRAELLALLMEARYELRHALATDPAGRDPVRGLFLSTWTRLAPMLRENALAVPGGRSLELAAFISAGNALQALDEVAPQLGFTLDSQTLRRLARLLAPSVSDDELAYSTAVDPELRELLGLPPELAIESPEETAASGPFAWLIPTVHASTVSTSLVQLLTGWVPAAADLDRYLLAMEQLLDESIAAERARGTVPAEFFPLYQDLVRATAWQESCWRQFVAENGTVVPIRSSAGSVGLMQINQHVWRNIYDLEALQNNVGYNARAGSEILSHYLVDYAIKRGEHTVNGNVDDLARATYGVYNGGPRHLTRYRQGSRSAYLRSVDAGFWEKYQALRTTGASAVKQCYGGA
jgi:hypothetical protein